MHTGKNVQYFYCKNKRKLKCNGRAMVVNGFVEQTAGHNSNCLGNNEGNL
jgi:hypothetical protein